MSPSTHTGVRCVGVRARCCARAGLRTVASRPPRQLRRIGRMWNPDVYRGLVGALTVGQIGGAVWEGAESRFGKTMWQGIDSEIIAGVERGSRESTSSRARGPHREQSMSVVSGQVQPQFPERRGRGRRGARYAVRARYAQRIPGNLRVAAAAALRRRRTDQEPGALADRCAGRLGSRRAVRLVCAQPRCPIMIECCRTVSRSASRQQF